MSQEELFNESWEHLKTFMQKEVGMMREILANMHQEELSLLLHDQRSWTQVMQDRSLMIERLSKFRLERLKVTETLEKSAAYLLESCEILTLRDQILALLDRMNSQHSRNEQLLEQTLLHSRFDMPPTSYCDPRLKPLAQGAKRKASVATYDPNS